MQPFKISESSAGKFSAGVRVAPDHVDAMVLLANTQAQYAVPNNTRIVTFSPTDNFYARVGNNAVIPTGNVATGFAPELNPAGYELPLSGGSTINFNSPANCVVTICCYK